MNPYPNPYSGLSVSGETSRFKAETPLRVDFGLRNMCDKVRQCCENIAKQMPVSASVNLSACQRQGDGRRPGHALLIFALHFEARFVVFSQHFATLSQYLRNIFAKINLTCKLSAKSFRKNRQQSQYSAYMSQRAYWGLRGL